MKYWGGYLTAAVFGAITWVLMQFGERFSQLVDMVYPYVIRTMEAYLAEWSGGVDFLLWQLLAVALAVVILASLVVVLAMKKNLVTWAGWVLAALSLVYMLHTALWGLNYYAGDLAEDMRLEVAQYTLEELTEATEYYRDKANSLSLDVPRDSEGNVEYPDFDTLANMAGEGFQTLTYSYSYPVFAGSTYPVKELGWADMYTSMGITGFTFGLTGEAAVNPQIPDVSLPFTICHEMAHRMCIASERDANFTGFLACSVHSDVTFRYSAYFMAYRYCYNALASVNTQAAAAAAARVSNGVGDALRYDLNAYNSFYSQKKSASATKIADTVNDTYLKASGEVSGVASYGQVCDLLVNWHIQTVVLPSLTVEESPFDPYDENQVDLSGIVNARGN
ncbi:MAG: DUF3810 domain-containing protein [Oscillospiraceae bacterium]|nr:DUF3810 domain-containing protein [Oscillospiraceae bacterium]